jgi:hypothetical protein
MDELAGVLAFIAAHRPAGSRSFSRDRPARASTRLTVASDTPVCLAMCLPVRRRRRSATIASATAALVRLGLVFGREGARRHLRCGQQWPVRRRADHRHPSQRPARHRWSVLLAMMFFRRRSGLLLKRLYGLPRLVCGAFAARPISPLRFGVQDGAEGVIKENELLGRPRLSSALARLSALVGATSIRKRGRRG